MTEGGAAIKKPVIFPGQGMGRDANLDALVCGLPDLPRTWQEAVLLVDKPSGMTSHDVVRRLRRVAGTRKIGHAGTLDPLATGLLICLLGNATRLARIFVEMDKTYSGTMRIGETTPSFDADTPVTNVRFTGGVTDMTLSDVAGNFVGQMIQLSPTYSAVRVGGERLYHRARRGDATVRPPRVVDIYSFEIQGRTENDVQFSVTCSKGTYVRTLVDDFGGALGVGAHITKLRRTRVGKYDVDRAWPLCDLVQAIKAALDVEGDDSDLAGPENR